MWMGHQHYWKDSEKEDKTKVAQNHSEEMNYQKAIYNFKCANHIQTWEEGSTDEPKFY